MFKTIKKAWSIPEIRKRILYTILLIVIFRLGSHISVPFVDFAKLDSLMRNSNEGLLGLVNLITGGAFSRLSIFAMSISPYISASIIVQLLGMIFPSIEAMIKEGGDLGKRKIQRIQKTIAILIAFVQGAGLYIAYNKAGVFLNPGFLTASVVVMSFLAGVAFLSWVADDITKKGVGNGMSTLIFAGCVASIPANIHAMFTKLVSDGKLNVDVLLMIIGVVFATIALITVVTYVHKAERRVPVQYAKKVVGRKMYGGQNTYIPLKLIMAGVMPIIFASAFISFPAILIKLFGSSNLGTGNFLDKLYTFSVATTMPNVSWGLLTMHALAYLILIILFTFFYTFATFNPAEISTNLKQNGGFVPGIRAGKPTTEFLTSVLIKLTTFGGVFLSLVAIIPMFTRGAEFGIAFGGTSILIIVGVALEMITQVQSLMVVRHHKGFLD